MKTENELVFKEGKTYADVISCMNNSKFIVVKAIRLNVAKQFVECYISQEITGIIPLNEFSTDLKVLIDDVRNLQFYPQIAHKIGKTIAVYVISEYSGEDNFNFVLSRKKVMTDFFTTLNLDDIIRCEIFSITDRFLCVDCGMGIFGRIHISQAVVPITRSLKDSEFRIGEILKAKITSRDVENCRLTLSLIEATNITYNVGDVIYGKIREQVPRATFDKPEEEIFYVEILPTHKIGVLRAKHEDNLFYNDKVICLVTKNKEIGKYNLSLVEKLAY